VSREAANRLGHVPVCHGHRNDVVASFHFLFLLPRFQTSFQNTVHHHCASVMTFDIDVRPLALQWTSLTLACYGPSNVVLPTNTHLGPSACLSGPTVRAIIDALERIRKMESAIWYVKHIAHSEVFHAQLALAVRCFGVPERGRPKDACPQHAQSCG